MLEEDERFELVGLAENVYEKLGTANRAQAAALYVSATG
jgi:hypothetical protein